MDQESKRTPEPKNTSTTWFALVLVAALSVALFLVLAQDRKTLSFSQFEQLMQNTKYVDSSGQELADGFSGKIEFTTKDRNKRVFVVERPNDLKISETEIRGKCIYYEKAKSLDGTPPTENRTDFTVVKDQSDSTQTAINDLLATRNINSAFVKRQFIEQYGGLILLMALTLGLFYWMLRRLGGSGGPMQFGRSRGKLYAEEDLGVSFSDVAGIDEAVEEVREVVDFLKNPEKYQRLGGKIPRGVLLVGPPGTGKTLLAKAIAGEADVPFFSLSGSDFVEMFVGVGAARVRDMFQQAEAKSPCIIFIDELDALGKTRGGQPAGGHDEREQTLNALLVEMDGFSSNSGVIVMAATNRPETLDQALMRPGRFDRHVLVDRPDVRGREEILLSLIHI